MALDVTPGPVKAEAQSAAAAAEQLRGLANGLAGYEAAGSVFQTDAVIAQVMSHLREQWATMADNADELADATNASADSITEIEQRNSAISDSLRAAMDATR